MFENYEQCFFFNEILSLIKTKIKYNVFPQKKMFVTIKL